MANRVRILRWTSYLLLVGMFAVLLGLAVFYTEGKLTDQIRVGGLGFLAVLFLVWLMVERGLGRVMLAALARTELSNDATFDMLYNNSPVAHITLDQFGGIIDFNPATVRLLHTEVTSLRGQSFFSLCAPEFDSSVLAQKMKAGLTINELELPLVTEAATRIWVLLSVYSLRRRGELLVTLVDITEQKKVDTAKSEFVALAAHQLRTPVAAIRYAAELLQRRLRDGGTERNVAYLDKVNRNVVRMLALINDFLHVSKLEMGTFATTVTRVEVGQFITDILDEFDDRIAKQQITVSRQGNPAELAFTTDPRLLNIILSNLVSNAVKYTPNGGRLEIVYTDTGSGVRFEINDSGIGIPAAEIPQLFSKFFRASNARTMQGEGTGLGLYIVDQAIKQLGGTIEVDSGTGAGTRFTVNLPSL